MGVKDLFDRVENKWFARNEKQVSPTFEAAIRCHKGKVREENQDRVASYMTALGALFIVADGVGGLTSGALAAQMAVDGYGDFLASAKHNTDPNAALQRATQVVNEAICNESAKTQQLMGSTVALVLLQYRIARIGHAGDSRVYLVRDGVLTRLTRDHSIVQKMVDHGIISDAQSMTHPDASVLTLSLGQTGTELELSETELSNGDALLLCSDGLWGYVDNNTIQDVVCSSLRSAEEITDALLDLAMRAGGGDNISIIFVKVRC